MSDPSARWSDLGQRMLSGGLVAGVGLIAVWMGGLAFHLIVAIVSGIVVMQLFSKTLRAMD